MGAKMSKRLGLLLTLMIIMSAPAGGQTPGSPTAPGATLGKGYEISLPDKKWSLVIDLPGFVVMREEGPKGDQLKSIMASKGEMIVGVNMHKKLEGRTPQEIRESLWSRLQEMQKRFPGGIQFVDVRRWESGQMSVLEFTNRGPMDIRNMTGFLLRDGVSIMVDVSKRRFQSGEEQQLREILNSVRFKEK